MPNVEAANISYNLLRVNATNGITVGPILMGMNQPANIVTPISTVRRIVNMIALTAVERNVNKVFTFNCESCRLHIL